MTEALLHLVSSLRRPTSLVLPGNFATTSLMFGQAKAGRQHLVALRGAHVEVTLDIAADMPEGAPDHVVRTVTENGRTLKFTSQAFEEE